jgi:CRP-like cAMP-binding protein
MWRDTLIDASVFREWVLNVGRRDAKARVAHMLCEFAVRCEDAGLGSAESFAWPMTQEHIADATGLTSVHVNRTLKALTLEGALECERGRYQVADWSRLTQIGEFDKAYLHAAAA